MCLSCVETDKDKMVYLLVERHFESHDVMQCIAIGQVHYKLDYFDVLTMLVD